MIVNAVFVGFRQGYDLFVCLFIYPGTQFSLGFIRVMVVFEFIFLFMFAVFVGSRQGVRLVSSGFKVVFSCQGLGDDFCL